ncbi:RdgB/HAM1 family non-canonical purine NTP pyrophosphatase [Nitrosophilus alvini]|uniref:RdgB/HAM1 family non-canonical purine NTP pyrophosphatase n=1 Tax=Nitrosophilus alvini TaxID=2714855 RepID=UPI00190DC8BE|nr:RdgB/HAM1 family non-canonical purine NTP pyrophosphatase [Nitrosophilus alvini]
MKVILATSNKGKIEEIKNLLHYKDVIPYKEVLEDLEIEETGSSFKENAVIKAQTIYEKIKDSFPEAVVISDDSGITVPALGNIPGIYSARFAGPGASDKENLQKLVNKLKKVGLEKTPAYYSAAVAIASKEGIFTVHGWMYGDVIDKPRGDKGFGYDPMFIPKGYDKTLGELDEDIKKKISHRSKALNLAKKILKILKRDTGEDK